MPFSKEDEIWIVQHSGFLKPTQLRRAFIKERRSHNNHHKVPDPKAFLRLVRRFQETGGLTAQSKEKEAAHVTPENIKRVECYFTENTTAHLREASADLDLSVTTVWHILRQELKWKPYKPVRVN